MSDGRNHVSERPEVGREIGVRSLPLQQDQMQADFNFLAQEPEIVYQQLTKLKSPLQIPLKISRYLQLWLPFEQVNSPVVGIFVVELSLKGT